LNGLRWMNSPATGAFDHASSSRIPSILGETLTGMATTVFLPSWASRNNGTQQKMKRRKPVFFITIDRCTNILEVYKLPNCSLNTFINSSKIPLFVATISFPKIKFSPELKSVTFPPAFFTKIVPAATSHGLSPYS